MIALPSWFTRPKGKKTTPPTSVELTEQLATADADMAALDAKIETARLRLRAERSESAATDLEQLKAEKSSLAECRDILSQELTEAQSREAAEQRTRDLAEADEIAKKVCHAGIIAEATDRAQRRLDLHVQLAELEREDAERRRELSAQATRATALREQHGEPGRIDDRSTMIGSDILLAEMADEHARTLPAGDPRREYLMALVHRLAPSRMGGHRMVPRPEQAEAQA